MRVEGMGSRRQQTGRLFAAGLVLLMLVASTTAASDADEVLGRGETFFRLLKEKNYGTLWGYLSKRSQATIIGDTMKNLGGASDVAVRKAEIEKDFSGAGNIARAYWSGFLAVFNPDSVLDESRWTIESVKKESAVIVLRHRKAEAPVQMRMVKEDGLWRIGLVETFWGK
jgi:hypothetical protein